MPSCDYCDDEFEDEAAYLDHLESAHYDDLDRIDRRRVDERDEDSGFDRSMLAAVAIVGLLVVGGGAYAMLTMSQSAGDVQLPEVEQRPTGLGEVHSHGTIVVTVDGHTFDFSQGEYQLQSDYFHFEGGQGEQFHVHARGVTLQYALNTLDIGVTADRVVWEDQEYERDDPDTEIAITVNGDPVDPATYVLQDGDDVEVVVETTG